MLGCSKFSHFIEDEIEVQQHFDFFFTLERFQLNENFRPVSAFDQIKKANIKAGPLNRPSH